MVITPNRLFFDTNIYILGAIDSNSCEGQIIEWLESQNSSINEIQVIISDDLIEQILRVAKRLKNKDWGGELVARIWQKLQVDYVQLDDNDWAWVKALEVIPREDEGVYLTAKKGKAQCFVSANYKLIKTLVKETGEFECLTPEEFVNRYL